MLDGGPALFGIESTVVWLAGGPLRILRPGSVSRAALAQVVGPVGEAQAGVGAAGAQASPGLGVRHYAPAGLVRLVGTESVALVAGALLRERPPESVGVLLCGDRVPVPPGAQGVRLPQEPAGYARGLYAALRDLEDLGCARLVLEDVPDDPPWEAVRDRLRRAAG